MDILKQKRNLFKLCVFFLRVCVVKPHDQFAVEALLVVLVEKRGLRVTDVQVTNSTKHN